MSKASANRFNKHWISMLVLALSPMTQLAHGADGDLDINFGGTGIVSGAEVTPDGQAAIVYHRVSSRVFPDGSVAISGTRPHVITKYLPDGNLDANFGSGGSTEAPLGPYGHAGTGLVRSHTGDLFSMAAATDDQNNLSVVICRFSADGQPAVFSATNTQCVDHLLGIANLDWPNDLAIDASGGIVVVGLRGQIVRFNADGSADQGIGPNGIYVVTPLNMNDLFHYIESIEIEGDAIYLTGWLEEENVKTNGIVHKFRLQPDAEPTRDPDFNQGNYVLVPCGATDTSTCVLRDSALYSNSIVATGFGQFSGVFGTVVRLDKTSGEIAPIVSVLVFTAGPTTNADLRSIAAQSNGDFVVAGILRADPNAVDLDRLVVARVRAGCTVPYDSGFGSNGWVALPYAIDRDSMGTSVAIGNGRLYAAGYTYMNGPIVESIAAFENSVALSDGIFAHDFELPCE